MNKLVVVHWAVSVLMLLGLQLPPAQPSNDSTDNVLPDSCAIDPDYKEFEKIQADAYREDKAMDFRIVLSPDFKNFVIQKTRQQLEHYPHDKNLHLTPTITEEVQDELRHLNVPTCLENPLYYLLMTHLANDVELARFELGLPSTGTPKFGSLPSSDINAYTYRVREGRGQIIAINAQLFNFIIRMSQLAAIGVDPTFPQEGLDSQAKITDTLLNISYSEQNKRAFVSTVLGLSEGRAIGKSVIDGSKEIIVSFFVGAMERFVFAHEYGHLINRDISQPVLRPNGATGIEEHEVLGRSWRQELNADATGARLLIQLLRGSAADNPAAAQYYYYALKAPMFLFECMEILDRTNFVLINHAMPPTLTDEYKTKIRDCAAKALKEEKIECDGEGVDNHPPAWLRRERVEKQIDKALSQLPNSATRNAAAQKGSEMLLSIDVFWDDSSGMLLEEVIKESTN